MAATVQTYYKPQFLFIDLAFRATALGDIEDFTNAFFLFWGIHFYIMFLVLTDSDIETIHFS